MRNDNKISCSMVGLGENIRQKRIEHGISQEQLAERLDISRQSVSKWENGLTEPSKRNLTTLAGIFGCQMSDLMESKGNKEEGSLLMLIGVYWRQEDEESIQNFFREMPFDVYEQYDVGIVILCGGREESQAITSEILQSCLGRKVDCIQNLWEIHPNHIYRMNEADIEGGVRVFFEKIADYYGRKSLGVVLTESRAASEGLSCIWKAGGITIQRTSKRRILACSWNGGGSNTVSHILTPVVMGSYIASYVREQYVKKERELSGIIDNKYINRVLENLEKETDFPVYDIKEEYILVGLKERMKSGGTTVSSDFYGVYLEETMEERQALLKSLIRIVRSTASEPFELLKLKGLFRDLKVEDTLRIWVMDCGNGLEAYAVAMLLCDNEWKDRLRGRVKIFATDIDEETISSAIAGRYRDEDLTHLPKEWKERFFRRDENGWQISLMIRDMVIFSVHDVVVNPLFTRLDLVVCRNALRFFRIRSRRHLVMRIAYALKQNGILILGNGQEIEEIPKWFSSYGKYRHILKKKTTPPLRADFKEKDRVILSKIIEEVLGAGIPSSIITNDRQEIIYTGIKSNKYFQFRNGPFSRNLFDNINHEIGMRISIMIHHLRHAEGRSNKEKSVVKGIPGVDGVLIIYVLLRTVQEQNYFLIWFEEEAEGDGDEVHRRLDREKRMLENELHISKKSLFSALDELSNAKKRYELANEKLQSTNEELAVINEELQNSNRELTAVNSQLTIVNSEYQKRMSVLRSFMYEKFDLCDFLQIEFIFLDKEFHICQISPGVPDITNVRESDIDRDISDIALMENYMQWTSDIREAAKDKKVLRVIDNRGFGRFAIEIAPCRSENGLTGFFGIDTEIVKGAIVISEGLFYNKKQISVG